MTMLCFLFVFMHVFQCVDVKIRLINKHSASLFKEVEKEDRLLWLIGFMESGRMIVVPKI